MVWPFRVQEIEHNGFRPMVDCLVRSHWATFGQRQLRIFGRTRRGDIMKTTQVFIVFGWLLASGVVSTSDVMAADLQYDSRVRVVTRSAGCGWRHTCCPDPYSCFSLYGAYGPYGGTAYWSRYTYGGWGYVR